MNNGLIVDTVLSWAEAALSCAGGVVFINVTYLLYLPLGLLNLVNPTFAEVMGGLALGRVSYDKWIKFTWPLLINLLLLYAIVLSVGVFMPGQIF
jgi:uncharacterized ion transporter superfamily protein YfcC